MTALERFLSYIQWETTSSETSGLRPSTPGQRLLTEALAEEMRAMGVENVRISEADGAVYGDIPANTDAPIPALGFLAHVDTSDAASGKDVKARIVEQYDGGVIRLNETVSMSPDTGFSCLREVVGEDLIVTDGTTLLGADDKAGVAEIMTMAQELLRSDRPHGRVSLAFTTDEEIGAGPDLFDVKGFGCDFAYTVDGGPLGELEYENFNAASATVTVKGLGVHPGGAKNMMKNACEMAMEFHAMLPAAQKPEYTEGYEGFIHLMEMTGTVTEAKLQYILRDHDLDKLREKQRIMEAAAAFLNGKYGAGTVILEGKDTYFNMREKIEPHRHLLDAAAAAFRSQGVEPKTVPIRGGTDGAQLSFKGLPCPNLSTGGYQFHGVFEFIPVRALEVMPKVLLEIVYSYGRGEYRV